MATEETSIKRAFFDWPEGQVHYRIGGSGEPLLLIHQTPRSSDSTFGDALVLSNLVNPCIQFFPEFLIFGTVLILAVYEHPVVFALNFFEGVTDSFTEIVVGLDDRAIHLEFNHSLGIADCAQLTGQIAVLFFLLDSPGDVFPSHDSSDTRTRLTAGSRQTDFQVTLSHRSGDRFLSHQTGNRGAPFQRLSRNGEADTGTTKDTSRGRDTGISNHLPRSPGHQSGTEMAFQTLTFFPFQISRTRLDDNTRDTQFISTYKGISFFKGFCPRQSRYKWAQT